MRRNEVMIEVEEVAHKNKRKVILFRMKGFKSISAQLIIGRQ